MFLEITGDGLDRFWTGKISNQRYDQVLLLHLPDESIPFFRCEISPTLASAIRGDHQIVVTRKSCRWTPWAGKPVVHPRSAHSKHVENGFDLLLIIPGRLEAMLFHEQFFDGLNC